MLRNALSNKIQEDDYAKLAWISSSIMVKVVIKYYYYYDCFRITENFSQDLLMNSKTLRSINFISVL